MKKLLSKGFVLFMMIGLLVACGTDNQEQTSTDTGNNNNNDGKKILKMATSADFAPFESYNPDGEMVGFDIELAEMIAEELGYELQIEDMKFDGLIGALQAERVDMVMSGMSADEKRRENVDFSIEYNESSEMLLSVKDSPIKDLESLTGKTIGVQLGSIQEEGAERLGEQYDFEVKKIDDGPMIIQELISNRIDVAYMDKDVAIGYLEAQDLYGFDDPTSSSPGMAVAFPKGSDLVDDVNNVLEKLEENGELQSLKDKWLTEKESE